MARPNNDHVHLRRLRDIYARMGCFPSYSRMADALGFKAKNAAFKFTQRLISTGHLAKSVGGRLAPGPEFFTMELSDDEIRAGFGAEGNATGLLHAQALDQMLVSRPSRTVFVRVRGESMVDAGILNGDIAVVETSANVAHGDIVVAEIDGDHTIKEYRTARGRLQLMSHGANPRVVDPRDTFNIIGVVRGIVRNYKPLASTNARLHQQGKPL